MYLKKESPMDNVILFVIVLYKCALKDSLSYRSLLSQYDALPIFVYDNSPNAQNINLPNVFYYHDPQNSGLGVAYNMAAKYAKEYGFKWLLLLDQDTIFPEGALNSYAKAIKEHCDVEMIVPKHQISTGRFISPTRYIMKTSWPVTKVRSGYVSFKDAAPINSGTMLSVESFYKVGGYDPEVILDFSDIRFMEKYSKVYDFFYVMNVICTQDFSIEEKDVKKLLQRFLIFMKCAKVCKRERGFDSISYFFVVFKRMVRLLLQTKNKCFLNSFISVYILNDD